MMDNGEFMEIAEAARVLDRTETRLCQMIKAKNVPFEMRDDVQYLRTSDVEQLQQEMPRRGRPRHNGQVTSDEFLKVQQAAIVLGLSRTMLYKLIQDGRLPVEVRGGVKHIRASDVETLRHKLPRRGRPSHPHQKPIPFQGGMMNNSTLLRIAEAAQVLNRTESRISQLIRAGRLPVVMRDGLKHLRINDVEALRQELCTSGRHWHPSQEPGESPQHNMQETHDEEGRMLSVLQEHKVLLRLELAGLSAEDAQEIIDCPGNQIASLMMACVKTLRSLQRNK